MLFFRSPYRDLLRSERARQEGFGRPYRRTPLFTRALRLGALGLIGYHALRTPAGQRLVGGIRARYPAPFERVDAWLGRSIERLAERSLQAAMENPGMQRDRPLLNAALGVHDAQYAMTESLRAHYVQRQIPFNLTNYTAQMADILGTDESGAMEFIANLQQGRFFEQFFATRTRRRQLLSQDWLSGAATDRVEDLLRGSRAFLFYRRHLQGLGLNEQQIERLTVEVFTPAITEAATNATLNSVIDLSELNNELRRRYNVALERGEIENIPLAELLRKRGYRDVSLFEALGFGYTVNDPELALAFSKVRPEYYGHLDITIGIESLPEEVREAYYRYGFLHDQTATHADEAVRRRMREELQRRADEDPMLALGRFLYLRERHRRNIIYRAFDLAGEPRPDSPEVREDPGLMETYGMGDEFRLFEFEPNLRVEGEPMIASVNLPDFLVAKLKSIHTASIMYNPEGRAIDLTYIPSAMEHGLRDISVFGIPLAPGVFSLQPFRMFPWFRPSDSWFTHVDSTSHQPILSRVLGRRSDEPVGSDLFILGDTMIRVDPVLFNPVTMAREDRVPPPPGHVYAPQTMGGVTVNFTPVEGEWAVHRVRGMTMRGMMQSLMDSADEGEYRGWLGRLLRLGDQGESSWFGKFRRSFFGPFDEEDPRSVWRWFRGHIDPNTRITDPEMVSRLSQLMTTVAYQTDFDTLEFIRAYARALDQAGFRDEEQHPNYATDWAGIFEILGEAKTYEEALDILIRDQRLSQFRAALIAVAQPWSASEHGLAFAERLGLMVPYAIGNERDALQTYMVNVRSSAFQNLISMGAGMFAYLGEPYTPDRPEHLFDPIPGTIAGLPESKLRVDEFLKAMVLEHMMQTGWRFMDPEPALAPFMSAVRSIGDDKAAAWLMASLVREAADSPRDRFGVYYDLSNLASYIAFSQRESGLPSLRFGFEALSRRMGQIFSPFNVMPELDDDVDVRSSIFVMRKGAPFGSRQWFTDYFTRWNRIETESDLYRYFVGWRLNEMLKPYGLGLGPESMRTPGTIFTDLAMRRLLPALGGYMAWRYLNTEMRFMFGYSPADLIADVGRMAQYGATAVMDVTGITGLKKRIVSEIPGLDVYFQPRDLDELQFYHRYGLAAVRYGRGWLSGSRSALVGEGVYANVPPWYRGMRSFWQAARNADIATLQAHTRGDIPLPTPRNPLAPVFYIVRKATGIADREWAERHRRDRPYPVAYVRSRDFSPFSIAGVRAEADLVRAGNLEPLLMRDSVEMPAVPRRNYRSFMLAVGMSPRLREELLTPPGAEPAPYELPPVQMSSPIVERTRFTLRELFHRISEIQGLYGWLQRLGLDALIARENPVLSDSPGWAYSFSRRFWESLYGGLDILPWHNELNELLRRFVPKRRPTEFVYYNPIPNDMPYWIPERLRYGDPYIRIHAGELRLPGEAYRWANPYRFGLDRPGPHDIRQTNLLTLSAEYIGASREHQFAALTGMQRAAGLYEELPDEVLKRVMRRYAERLPEDAPIAANVLTTDPELRVSAYTMLVTGAGRGAEAVHAVPASVDADQARIAMMERLRQLGIRRGRLLFVEDERTGAYREEVVRYDRSALEPYLRRWREHREQLMSLIESGEVNEGLFYSPLQRLEILADVAPKSPEFRRLRSWLSAHQSRLTEEERKRFQYALEIAERTGERYHLYPYRNIQLESMTGRAAGFDDRGRLVVEGQEQPVQLAGIRLRIGEIKRRYGLPRTASAEEAYARLAEEFGLRGADVELQYGGGRGVMHALVRARGRDINRELVRLGLAVPDETDRSLAARRMRQGRLRRLWNWLVDTLTHMDTPLHTKFLRVRSPLEEWERGHVFGTRSGSWESPFSTYIMPTVTSIVNKGPISAAIGGAVLGSLFGYTTEAKRTMAAYGAMIGAGLSLARTLIFPRGYIPARTRRRWEIDEYIDALQYAKYMRLYRQEAELAKEREGIDVEQWIAGQSEQVERRRNEIRQRIRSVQASLARRDDGRLREELERLQAELADMEEREGEIRREGRRRRGVRERLASMYERLVRRLGRRKIRMDEGAMSIPQGEHAQRALLYRALAEQTAMGTGVARTPGEALRTVRPYVKDIYRQIMETGTPREKRRFYDLLPDYQKLVFHDLLAPDRPLPKPPDPTRLFHKFGLPGPSWRGWDPDVDLELLRAQLVESRGLDPVDAGVYPTERAVSRVVFEEIGMPLPISSTRDVQARMQSLFGSGGWRSIAGATVQSRVGGNYYMYVDYYDREYERNVYRHYLRALSAVG